MSNDLNSIALKLRKKIVEISYQTQAHHIGSEMSCIDILVALYFDIMNIDSNNPTSKERDFFILSKGHAALALYVTLMEKGFFSENFLKNEFLTDGGKLGGHPDKNLNLGIEISSGSLGHGLSIGSGIALSNQFDNLKNKTFVLLGDGECNEGSIWESVMFSAHHKLNNLIAIIDYNKLQGFGSTTDILNLDSLADKFQSFGWNVYSVNGHNINDFVKLINNQIIPNNKPNVIIADTIKGKGISFMENRFESHYELIDRDQYKKIINELESK